MNILFISYDSYKYDGRLRELIKVAQELGEVTFITRDEGEEPISGQHILYKGSGYLKFISFCAKQAKKMQDVDAIFIDNRKGILPGYLAKRLTGATYVIQDCRELYDMKSAAGIPGRIGCLMEKIFTRHSDVVIAANAFRAKLMVKMFGLKKRPFNYENIRRLAYSSEERARQVEQECQEFFAEEKFRIISTAGCDMTRTTGKMIEAMKLAFVDGMHYVTDPRYMGVTPAELLSKEYAAKRRELISDTALLPEHGDPHCGGTVYLCTADGEGNMVSYIQSNYRGFGSGVVVPGTGIALNDRGNNFTLDENHFNCLAPGKKPYHTIIPGFLTKDGKAVGPFGVMGGFMQPQGHLQVVTDTVDFLMNPQDALDAPRWQWVGGKEIHVEQNFPEAITKELIRRGHDGKVQAEETSFGRGEIIWRNDEGVLVGATEPRADGVVAAW